MALPIEHDALQQIRTAQEGRVGWRRAAEHDVIAAARARMPAVEQEFVVASRALRASS